MSDTLFSEAPARVTERDMLDLLRQRYTRLDKRVPGRPVHRFAFAEHVADRPMSARRIADFMAIDCYIRPGTPYNERRNEIHGHEVKVSRSDWLAELRDPDKAQAFLPFVDCWWLVVSDRAIVKPDELPDGWGLLVKAGGVLRCVVPAPRRVPEPMPSPMLACWLRATAKTAARA